MYGGTSTYIPLKVNQAGIIPVIFASVAALPAAAAVNVWTSNATSPLHQHLPRRPEHPVYLAVYFALIVFFTYFYVAITFNPVEVSDNMKKYGGFVPGIRPAGRPPSTSTSSCRASPPSAPSTSGLVAVLPYLLFGSRQRQTVPFGGTAILIIVGVGLETVKQVESQLMLRNYEGFLR
jgi:preprotein translocase subunit SecY